MELKIPYGDGVVELSIPDRNFLGTLEAQTQPAAAGEEALLRAVSIPLGRDPLADFAGDGDRVLVLVNDATRPTPTAALLSGLWDIIGGWDLQVLVATGTHASPSEEECVRIFGDLWRELSPKVHFHDAGAAADLVEVGVTAAGTRVKLNRMVTEAERILVLGSVEAHYFAGFTGGRKILLPGVAGRDAIEQNHRLAMRPEAQALRLEGNPVHEDMDQVIDMLGDREIFAALAVQDCEHNIHSVAAGDLREAFHSAARTVEGMVSAPFGERADIVLAVAEPPLDCNLYQAQKSIENGRLALREGGILILASACAQGTGNTAFLGIMEEKGNPIRVLEDSQKDYRLGYHKAARLALAASEADLWAVTGVEDEVATTAFLQPQPGLQAAIDQALARHPEGTIWLLRDAGATVPRQIA